VTTPTTSRLALVLTLAFWRAAGIRALRTVLVTAAPFLLPLVGVLFGAFAGLVVGLFFEQTIIGFLTRLGIDMTGFAMWQIGASLGFLGAFFRSSSVNRSKA